MRRFGLLYIAPTILILLAALWPIVSGRETLYLRDVLTGHYPMKAAQAEALRQGEIPLVDVYRAGGQPLLGNPNGLPLYPDNLLYLVASPLRALNAHFWIHLLLAPITFYWLGRAWGLRRSAAWAAGVCYAASGFMLSLLNLYNLVAGAALAPAFAAACLEAWRRPPRRTPWAALALLWALLLLAGDPLFAALALIAGLAAGAVRERSLPQRPVRFAAALACGSALAAPMLVEFLRILPLSLRGYRSYSPESALLQSWDPRSAVEWFVPLCFGPPDFSFHGQRFYDGLPPLFYSFAPGLLCFLLVPLASPRRARSALWGWILVGSGIFLALGRWNPAVRALYEIEAVGVLRYPVKVWLWVALGAAMLCGVGFERLSNGGGRRLAGRTLAVLATGFLAASAWLLGTGKLVPQASRWAEVCLLSLAVAALLAMALYLSGRRPAIGGALLLGVHLAGQMIFLAPLFDSDAVEPYVKRPEILSAIPDEARLVHGGFKNLFGPQRVAADTFPDPRTHWLTRSHFEQLYPYAGISWGRRYELDPSPEGLDSFFTLSLTQILPRMRDAERVRVLAASGVGVLLLDRPLDVASDAGVRLLARAPIAGGQLHVYEITPKAAPVQVVHRIRPTPHLNAALAVMTSPSFDPTAEVALPGEGAPRDLGAGRGAGRAEIVRESWDEIEIEVDAATRGVVVVQRTFHAIYRATLDGEPVPIEPANLHRLGIEVPPGRHRLLIRADRGPTRWAWGVAGLGLLGLVGLGAAGRSTRR